MDIFRIIGSEWTLHITRT